MAFRDWRNQAEELDVKSAAEHCEINFTLARQGVALVELEWP
jgi:hypothetical protein